MAREAQIGDIVRVISGPHEGRGGRIVKLADQAVGMGNPEAFAVIEYQETNAMNERYTDQIAVPVRRLKPVS